MTLDAQLHEVTSELSSRDVAVPPFGTIMQASRRRRRRLAFAAIVVVLLTGTGLAFALRNQRSTVYVGPPCRSGATQSSPAGTVAEQSGAIGGSDYVAWVQPDGTYGIVLTIDGSAIGVGHIATSGLAIDAADAQYTAFKDTFGVLYGKAPISVAKVRLELDTGESAEGSVQSVPGQPFVLFAFGVMTLNRAGMVNGAPATAVFLDAAGAEVTRVEVVTGVVHTPCSVSGSGTEEGVRTLGLDAQMVQWLAEYDPAEVVLLQTQAGGADHTDAYELVTVLEFRRACRETNRAADIAASIPPGDPNNPIDDVMEPELQRLAQRNNSRSESARMFSELRDKLRARDIDSVRQWLATNCHDALPATGSG